MTTLKPKFHLARHDSTRSTCQASRDERVEPYKFQHGGRRTSYSARLYKFSRVYALTYTNPIFLSNKIN